MRSVAVVVTLLVGASGAASELGPSDSFPKSAYLDEHSVKKAIEWGDTGKARPYPLFGKRDKSIPTMAVYTPFVRVALAAQEARRRGRSLSVNDLPAWVIEATVHVVTRTPRYVEEATLQAFGVSSLNDVPITQMALANPRGAIFLDYLAPLSLVRDLTYLDLIGGKPFGDAAAAAVFEPLSMTQNVDVYGWWRNENRYYPSHGVLDPEAMKAWR